MNNNKCITGGKANQRALLLQGVGGTMDVDPLLCEEPGLLNSLDPLFSLQGHLLQFFHISSLPKWYTRYSHQQTQLKGGCIESRAVQSSKNSVHGMETRRSVYAEFIGQNRALNCCVTRHQFLPAAKRQVKCWCRFINFARRRLLLLFFYFCLCVWNIFD